MIEVYFLTTKSREKTLKLTLDSYLNTDMNEKFSIVFDTDCTNEESPYLRQINSAKHILSMYIRKSNEPFMMFCEDDIIFNKHIKHNINRMMELTTISVAYLYNPGIVFDTIVDNISIADPDVVYGNQCILMHRSFVGLCIKNWDKFAEGGQHQDIIIAQIAKKFGVPIYYHTPTLVQHRDGLSTWGGPVHRSIDFDLEYKS